MVSIPARRRPPRPARSLNLDCRPWGLPTAAGGQEDGGWRNSCRPSGQRRTGGRDTQTAAALDVREKATVAARQRGYPAHTAAQGKEVQRRPVPEIRHPRQQRRDGGKKTRLQRARKRRAPGPNLARGVHAISMVSFLAGPRASSTPRANDSINTGHTVSEGFRPALDTKSNESMDENTSAPCCGT